MERKEPALISLLARLFIKPDPAREEPETRRAYGVLCGIVGICLNVLLFAGKFLAGTLSGSIAITAAILFGLSLLLFPPEEGGAEPAAPEEGPCAGYERTEDLP